MVPIPPPLLPAAAFLAVLPQAAPDSALIRHPPPGEPDGSRTLGIVPPYRGKPEPPLWLRCASHALAVSSTPNTRHYLYEAYAGGGGRWLVRYVRFPDGTEACTERQEVFLFGSDPLDPQDPPLRISAGALSVRARRAEWDGRSFVLVDKRDLTSSPAPRRR